MVWRGAAGLRDPIWASVQALMQQLYSADVRTITLIGDQQQTAQAVPSELAEQARHAHVFARITPGQKLRLVRTLQDTGAVIAMVATESMTAPRACGKRRTGHGPERRRGNPRGCRHLLAHR
jgi:magnesium-transporting ATPase (P-type)